MSKYLVCETFGHLLKITIDKPRKRNALDLDMYQELTQLLNEADQDESVHVVVLTGAGDFYSSGNDIGNSMTSDEPIEERLDRSMIMLYEFVKAFYSFSKLLIGIINGPCIGIAATTAALCDVLYAEESAYFYTPFTTLGLSAEGCSSYTFPRILGRSKAIEMLILSHKMSAQEALQFNFVSLVYKKGEFDEKIWPKLLSYSELPIGSVRAIKKQVSRFEYAKLEEANTTEIAVLKDRWTSEEALNAVMNFMMRKSSKI
jgi:peroxisomal 3,2-trans-enoyl-CoA isomerase